MALSALLIGKFPPGLQVFVIGSTRKVRPAGFFLLVFMDFPRIMQSRRPHSRPVATCAGICYAKCSISLNFPEWATAGNPPASGITRMKVVSWLRSLMGVPRRHSARRRSVSLESLEVRVVLAAPVIVHVDNTAAPGGDGTAERPFNSLPPSVPNADIVFVHRGDGTANGLRGTITLQNNQQLLGDGVAHYYDTGSGVVLLPGSTSGNLPILGGNSVILANNNVVDGFRMADASIASIRGTNVNGFTFANLHLFNEAIVGIQLTNVTGTGSLSNSSFANIGNDGLQIINTSVSPLNLTVSHLASSGGRTGVNLTGSNASIIANVQFSTFQNAKEDGIRAASLNASGNVSVTANEDVFVNNSRRGVDLTGNAGSLTFVSQSSQFVGNKSDGVRVSLLGNANFVSNFLTSNISNNGGEGVLIAGTGFVNLSATRSTFARNANSGIFSILTNGQGVYSLDQNLFDSNVANGFGLRTLGNQILGGTPTSLIFTRNVVTSNFEGLLIDRRDNTQFSAVIGNGPGQSGMGNTFRLNRRGLLVNAAGNGLTNALLVDDNLFESNRAGANYSLSADAVVVTTHHRNRYMNNSNRGVVVTTLQNSSFGLVGSPSVFGTETFSNNTLAAFEFFVNDPTIEAAAINRRSTQNVRIDGIDARTQITGGKYGVIVHDTSNNNLAGRASNWAILQTDINLQGSGVDGIQYIGTGGNTTSVTVGAEGVGENVTVANVGDDGVDLQAFAGNKTFNIFGNASVGVNSTTSFRNAGLVVGGGVTADTRGDGISLYQDNSASVVSNIFGVESTNNAGRGLTLDVRNELGSSTYFVGDYVEGNAGLTAARKNVFSNNSLQGTVVQTVTNFAEDSFLDLADDAPGSFIFNPYQDTASTDFVHAFVTYENNTVQFNGTVSTPVDGAVFSAMTNTRLTAAINANTFGGNQLSDVNILTQAGPEGPRSVNDFGQNPVRDRVRLDAVAHMDIAFGVVDNTGGNIPNAQRGNTGNQLTVSTFGNSTFLGSKFTGRFATIDTSNTAGFPFRHANRPAYGVYRVYGSGLLNGPLPGNEFVQTGVLQDIQGTFSNAGTTLFVPSLPPVNTIQFQAVGQPFPMNIA